MTEYAQIPNLATSFFRQASHRGDAPFLGRRTASGWVDLSWRTAAGQVAALARSLAGLGVAPGDRVALVSENRPEWAIADLGIMAAGAVTVPLYTTWTADDHAYVLNDCGAGVVIVSTTALARRVIAALAQCPGVTTLIALEDPGAPLPHPVRHHDWAALTVDGDVATVAAEANRLGRRDPACLIYTSGTSGRPKGVRLSHGAVLANCAGAHDLLVPLGLGDEVFLSFLPLTHSYEHTAGLHFPISIGARICHTPGVEHLARDMAEVRPTIMTAVPRLYEVLRQRTLHGVERQPKISRALFAATLALGRRRLAGRLTWAERPADALLDRLVRSKVRGRFGGRLKALVSGGGPLNPEIGAFFVALGIRVLQGYGLTEAAPVVSCNRPHDFKMHTVGPPLAGVEVRIAEDGEILVRGELVMDGYWNDPEATSAVLDAEGWLHTGDVGHLDADGHLVITDRRKDIIVNAGGDNISPARVEGVLALEPEIGQVLVHGDNRPHLVALIVPDETFAQTWAADHNRHPALSELVQDPAFRAAMDAAVTRANRTLSSIERVRKFALIPEPFTVDNGLMTPTLKLRRHRIRQDHGELLAGLYPGGGTVRAPS